MNTDELIRLATAHSATYIALEPDEKRFYNGLMNIPLFALFNQD
ncbi:hypothetical protein L580_3304 [Serratia fonticola AU-P3(3)]|nr:hypothetical protein L580_3304 [Serratia fonticola AU-P3(3)]